MFEDLRFAMRTLLRNPAFTAGAVLTLGLGIGANSTIFTLANAMLLRPMAAVQSPSELVWISGLWRDTGRTTGMSYPEFVEYAAQADAAFSGVLAFGPTAFSVAGGKEPLRVRGHLVSGSYFATLGVHPALGRVLQASDDVSGAEPHVVLGYRLWQQRFGGDPDVLRRPLIINGQPLVVVGIAREGFTGPERVEAADLWVPIAALPRLNAVQGKWLTEPGTLWLRVMGRLRSGTTIDRAMAIVATIAEGLARAHPDSSKNRTATLSSAASGVRPSDRGELLPIAGLLLTITALVLVIACANVANLVLARGTARSLELGVRTALGATRRRLVRQLLTESLVLGACAAVLAVLLSFWAADLLASQLSGADFSGLVAAPDARVLFFTALVACGSVCVFGLVPALTATRGALLPRLRETSSAGGRRSRLQGTFVVAQLSLSLVLLLAAGLSLRALQKAGAIDLGFNPERLYTASYDLVLQNYPEARRDTFRRSLRERIGALPGVTAVAIASLPPLSGTMVSTVAASTGDANQPVEARVYMNAVGPGYFATLELPIIRGRGITEEDGRGAPQVVLVNETLARQLWGDADPLGRTMRLDDDTVHVVGVARNSKYDEATEDPRAFLYLSLAQHATVDRETVLVRTAGSPARIASSVQAQLRALDPSLPIFDARTFDDVLKQRADKQRGLSGLFAAFGVVALLLAALGLYAVMAYAVARRTREMGVRLALGATPAQVTRLVAGAGLRLALTGVAIGSLLAIPLAQVLGALIFGVEVADLAAFAAACVLLVGVALAAALLPARRAARVDPMAALRAE
jgi:predicted permease